jgi:hypothetical protein
MNCQDKRITAGRIDLPISRGPVRTGRADSFGQVMNVALHHHSPGEGPGAP